MHRRARSTLTALLLLCLAACGGAPEPQARDEAAAKEQGRDTDKTVFDDMIQTQDRARAVEGVTMAAKAATDAAIEKSEGDSQDPQQ